MNKLFLIPVLCLTCVACNNQGHPKDKNDRDLKDKEMNSKGKETAENMPSDSMYSKPMSSDMSSKPMSSDMSSKPMSSDSMTPGSMSTQGETEMDSMIIQNIRDFLMKDDTLSPKAKNIKVIVLNGTVILRGPVATQKEKEKILMKIKEIKGIKKVDNQLSSAS